MSKIRVAVVGAGQFGRNHVRVVRQSERAELLAVVDIDAARAAEAAAGCTALTDYRDLRGRVDAAIVAAPTAAHAEIGCELMRAGIDVLVEKPIASELDSATRLIDTARAQGRILQVGHLERYNPAVAAVLWAAAQTGGTYYVTHQLKGASDVYGTFALVIGLLTWIYLGAHITLLSAEANVVRARRLWPRSFSLLSPAPRTEPDERALRQRAQIEERRPEERVEVSFRDEQK